MMTIVKYKRVKRKGTKKYFKKRGSVLYNNNKYHRRTPRIYYTIIYNKVL